MSATDSHHSNDIKEILFGIIAALERLDLIKAELLDLPVREQQKALPMLADIKLSEQQKSVINQYQFYIARLYATMAQTLSQKYQEITQKPAKPGPDLSCPILTYLTTQMLGEEVTKKIIQFNSRLELTEDTVFLQILTKNTSEEQLNASLQEEYQTIDSLDDEEINQEKKVEKKQQTAAVYQWAKTSGLPQQLFEKTNERLKHEREREKKNLDHLIKTATLLEKKNY